MGLLPGTVQPESSQAAGEGTCRPRRDAFWLGEAARV